jgi:hypothetical protein
MTEKTIKTAKNKPLSKIQQQAIQINELKNEIRFLKLELISANYKKLQENQYNGKLVVMHREPMLVSEPVNPYVVRLAQ